MAIETRFEETEFVYGENMVSIDETRGALHWLAEGMDAFEVLLIDDVGQQAEIHITDLVARPLTMWRLDAHSLSQVKEFWDEWQQYGKKEIHFH